MISATVLAHKQRGVVLLAFFAILFIAGAGVLISVLDGNAVTQRRNDNTVAAMREAKESLIAYATLYAKNYNPTNRSPGSLPCPDTNGDGDENATCGALSLGRLPQSITLPSGGIFPLVDYNADIDEQFWYSVAADFRRTSANVLNSSTASLTTLDGQGGIAAVLIAPGPANATQARPSNSSNRYLEDSNTSAPNFVTSTAVNPDQFNDRVLGITIDEIMTPVTRVVADLIKSELDAYHVANALYPLAVDFTAVNINPVLEPWFAANNWLADTVYTRISDDQVTLSFTGCPNITYTVVYNPPDSPNDLIRTGSRC